MESNKPKVFGYNVPQEPTTPGTPWQKVLTELQKQQQSSGIVNNKDIFKIHNNRKIGNTK